MAVTPHARALRDLSDRVEVVHAYSPTAAQREAFGRNFDFPLTERCEDSDICQLIAISAPRIAKNMATI
jgi:predicted dehydrogenase